MLSSSNKDTAHEYISTKEHEHAVLFRIGNYLVLITLRVFDWVSGIHFPDIAYYIIVSAVVGYDIQYVLDRFIVWRKK